MTLSERLKSPAVVFFLFAAALALYHSTVSDLLGLWLNSSNVTYTHGSLLLVVCVYLFYQRWKKVRAQLRVQPDLLGLVLLLTCSLLWFLAGLADIAIIQELLLVAVFCFILWSVLGFNNMKKLMFPILLIICAIPVWEIINEGWLQKITASVVARLMELVGYSVYREDALIHLSVGTFRVAQNCSGMRQLVAAITIGFIYSYINDIKIYWSLMIVLCLALLSFLVNTLRIFIVVMAGQLTNMEHYFVKQDHVTLGWILFAIAIFIFIKVVDKYLAHFKRNEKKYDVENRGKKELSPKLYLITPIVIALMSGPILAMWYKPVRVAGCSELSILHPIKGWRTQEDKSPAYRPVFLSADIVSENIFRSRRGETVYAYVGYFASQNQNHELISSLNKVADGDKWIQVHTAIYQALANKEITSVQESIIRDKRGNERLVWHWYYLSGKRAVRPEMAKFYGIWDKLKNNMGAAVILISVDITKDKADARKKLNLFVNQVASALEDAVDNIKCEFNQS